MQTKTDIPKKKVKFHKPTGIGPTGEGNEVFPPELMRRRWSKKEVVNIICEELTRNGKLTQIIREMIRTYKKGGE